MNAFEVEAWVLRIIDQVNCGAHSEDSRVELKSTWPKSAQAARQIAAHANAARGTPILWLIGVSETTGVVGADYEEVANWYPEVKSYFDGVTPELFDLNVLVNSKTVVALLFQTERAPFVVRNAAYGQTGGGSVEMEVPWREGRKTRSATRSDLIRLLEPLVHQPSLEYLGCKVTVNQQMTQSGDVIYRWFVSMDFYVAPLHSEILVIPFHRCQLVLSAENCWKIEEWETFRLGPPTAFYIGGKSTTTTKVHSLTIASSRAEVIIKGPGKLNLFAEAAFTLEGNFTQQNVTVQVKLLTVGGRAPIVITDQDIPPVASDNTSHFARWSRLAS
jgi:hypothetical protein